MAWAVQRSAMAIMYSVFSSIWVAFWAAVVPMPTKSSKLADVGMESTQAGCARILFSEAKGCGGVLGCHKPAV